VLRCPDGTTNCCQTNGTGIYTAEGGKAGIGDAQLMITHFINTGSAVTFQGRYFNKGTHNWEMLPDLKPGTVDSADYVIPGTTPLKQLAVTSVQESSTVPTWTLSASPASKPVSVTGAKLAGLTLHISFVAGERLKKYVLELDVVRDIITRTKPSLKKYHMRWRDEGSTASTQYCFDASGIADPVVFQQGIEVDPLTGHVTRNSNTDVTMSCFRGGPATVHGWGYPYQGTLNSTFYFDAGIHMKRASYCANSQFFTIAGTPIQMADDMHIQKDYNAVVPLEASWGRDGAVCLNFDSTHVRHWDIVQAKKFVPQCNNKPLPACPLAVQSAPYPPDGLQQYLADGPVR
jgi:hypothetical protein